MHRSFSSVEVFKRNVRVWGRSLVVERLPGIRRAPGLTLCGGEKSNACVGIIGSVWLAWESCRGIGKPHFWVFGWVVEVWPWMIYVAPFPFLFGVVILLWFLSAKNKTAFLYHILPPPWSLLTMNWIVWSRKPNQTSLPLKLWVLGIMSQQCES